MTLALLVAGFGTRPDPEPVDPAALSPLLIETADGSHRFFVELADTNEARGRGLMFRTDLPQDQGMLFEFVTEQPLSFWMKNTPLSLDLLFLDQAGVVVHIEEKAVPFSTKLLTSPEPARAVLEINGGVSQSLGVELGDRVVHAIFTGQPAF